MYLECLNATSLDDIYAEKGKIDRVGPDCVPQMSLSIYTTTTTITPRVGLDFAASGEIQL